jgi:hypothetical protein
VKYKVKNIDIRHQKKLYPEGSIIELEEENAENLAPYLDPFQEEPKSKRGKKSTITEPDNPLESSDNKETKE